MCNDLFFSSSLGSFYLPYPEMLQLNIEKKGEQSSWFLGREVDPSNSARLTPS